MEFHELQLDLQTDKQYHFLMVSWSHMQMDNQMVLKGVIDKTISHSQKIEGTIG